MKIKTPYDTIKEVIHTDDLTIQEEFIMAFFANLIYYVLKVIVYAALAFGGIMLGKKYREKKDLQKTK